MATRLFRVLVRERRLAARILLLGSKRLLATEPARNWFSGFTPRLRNIALGGMGLALYDCASGGSSGGRIQERFLKAVKNGNLYEVESLLKSGGPGKRC